MQFDVILPISLFIFLVTTIFVYQKILNKIRDLFEKVELGKYGVILFVLMLGGIITIVAFLPNVAVQILYLSSLSYLLASFSYLVLKSYYTAVFPPIVLILLYFLFWNNFVFNIFALIFACIIIIYVNNIFSWKSLLIFAILTTILDIFQVFGTGFMGKTAVKVLELKLPVIIFLPTFPSSGFILLGLGDIIFSGLLSIQMVMKKGSIAGIVTALTIAIALFFYEIFSFNTQYFTFFPATIVIVLGWLVGLAISQLII